MATKIQKWGNSLAVRLPKKIVDSLALVQGSEVVLTSKNDSVVVRIVEIAPRERRTLDEMLRAVTPKNIHKETDWGKPVGKEIW